MKKIEIIKDDESINDGEWGDFDPHNHGCFAGELDDDFDYETDHDIGN